MPNVVVGPNPSIARDKVGILNNSTTENINIISQSAKSDEIKYEVAEVIDIILDKKHKDYPKKEDDESYIGRVKVRRIVDDANKKDDDLPYAKPLNSNLRIYPVIGELVLTTYLLSGKDDKTNELYYLYVINLFGKENNNSFKGLSKPDENAKKSGDYQKSQNNPKKTNSSDLSKYGLFFKDENDKYKKLDYYEGDVILEGRHGQSLRFSGGRKKGEFFPDFKDYSEPFILLNLNSAKIEDKKKLREEDLDKDDGSILFTSKQEVKLTLGSNLKSSFNGSFPEKFSGKQIIMASDRLVLNAKKDECIISSKKSIGLTTMENLCVDAGKNVVIDSPKICLGNSADEPVLLGNKWKAFMEKFIDTLLSVQYYFGCLNPAPLMALKKELEPILSKQTFVKRQK